MIPDTTKRNVFVEGTIEQYMVAKQLIDSIVDEHLKMQMSFKS